MYTSVYIWRGDLVIRKDYKMAVEKNDVDISKLFEWGKEFQLLVPNTNKKVKLYIRLLGDSEINRARIYAIRKSKELRTKLRSPDTDEHLAYMQDYSSLNQDEVLELVLALSVKGIAQQAIKEVSIPYPVMPDSDAELEEQEKFQTLVDDYPNKRERALREYISKNVDLLKRSLQKESKEYLLKEYEKLIIDALCEEEMIKSFRDMSAYLGTYKDKEYTNLAFKSVDEFLKLPQQIKEEIIQDYLSLEVSVEDLKK